MCRISDPTLRQAWTDKYGSSYHEVTGRRLVQMFTYFGERYRVGVIVEMYDSDTDEDSLVAEVISSGSNMRISRTKMCGGTTRRAVLLKVIRCYQGTYTEGSVFGAFFWGHDKKRIRHSLLETLARL